jgi:RecA-family ATPase
LNYLHYLANQANPFWDAELYKVQASSRDRTGDKAKSEGDDRQKEDDAGSKDEAKSSAASDKPNTNKTSSPSWSAALPLIDISKWDDEQPPPQEWVVQDRIPVDSVCLFSGEGAAGKSLLQLQLSIATALNRDWLGMVPSQGPALFIDAEDDQTVLHRRAADILKFYSARFADVKDKLHLVSLSEHGAALAYFVRRLGWIEPTSLYRHLLEMVGDLKPKIIGIASSANVFAGSEIDRAQVTQFIALLNRLARRCHGAVVLISHPSLTGISTETGLSGSTQWHNAVRARFYLKAVKPIEGEQPDSNLRELVFLKNNYGSIAGSVALQYQDGLFVPIEGSNLDAKARIEIAKQVFLVLLQRFNRENRNVSATPGRGYGPSLFEPEQEARAARLTKQDLAEAMRQLIREAKIANEEYGKPGNRHHRLVVKFTRDEDAPF